MDIRREDGELIHSQREYLLLKNDAQNVVVREFITWEARWNIAKKTIWAAPILGALALHERFGDSMNSWSSTGLIAATAAASIATIPYFGKREEEAANYAYFAAQNSTRLSSELGIAHDLTALQVLEEGSPEFNAYQRLMGSGGSKV